jgi:hypothetical protein
MKSKTENLLMVMNVLSWIVFIGIAIKAGSVIISYFVSISNPMASKNLYNGTDFSAYREQSFGHYTFIVLYRILFYAMQAYVAFLLTRLLSSLNISRPFNPDVAGLLRKMSIYILGVWAVAMLYNIHVIILDKLYGLAPTFISGDFIFFAGIVYVLAQLFKRGVEIQSENELTV